jgi:hypothetical protein
MALEVESGMAGVVKMGGNTVGNITSWSLTKEVRVGEYVSSASGGYVKRTTGPIDWNGSFEFVGDGDRPDNFDNTSMEAGDDVTLILQADDGATKGYTGPVKITSIEINLDVSEEPISGTCNFVGNGALSDI